MNSGLKASNLSVGLPEYFKEQINDSQTACNDNRFENCGILPASQADLADGQGHKVSQEEEDSRQKDPCSMLSGISVGETMETVTVGLKDTLQYAQVSAVSNEEVADLEGVKTSCYWASAVECVNVDKSLVDGCLEGGVVYRDVDSVLIGDEKGANYTTHMESTTTTPSFISRTEVEEFKVDKLIEDYRVRGGSDLLGEHVFSSWGHNIKKQPGLPSEHGCADHETDGLLEVASNEKDKTLEEAVFHMPVLADDNIHLVKEHQDQSQDKIDLNGRGILTPGIEADSKTEEFGEEFSATITRCAVMEKVSSYCFDTTIKSVTEANILSKPKCHHYGKSHDHFKMEQNYDWPVDCLMETKQNCDQYIKADQSHNQSGDYAIEREQNYVHLQRSVHDKTRLELCGKETCHCYSLALGVKSPFDWKIGPKGDCRKFKGLPGQQDLNKDYGQETIIQGYQNIVHENNLETAAKCHEQKLIVGNCVWEIDEKSVKEVQEDFKFVQYQGCASGEDTNAAENRNNKILACGDSEGTVSVARKIQSFVNEEKEQKITKLGKKHSLKEYDKIIDAESVHKQEARAGIFSGRTNTAADYSRQASHRAVAYDDQTAALSHQQASIWRVEWELTQQHDTDKSLQNKESQPQSLLVQEPDLGVNDPDDGFMFNIQHNLPDGLHQNHLATVETQIYGTEVAGQDLFITGDGQIATSLSADQDLLVTRDCQSCTSEVPDEGLMKVDSQITTSQAATQDLLVTGTNHIVISEAADQECSLHQDCRSTSDGADSIWLGWTRGHTLVTDAKDNILETENQESIWQAGPNGADDDDDQEVSDGSFSPDDLGDVAGTLEHMAEMEHENLAAEELKEQVEHIAELMDEQGNMFEPYDGEMGLEGCKGAEDSCRCNSRDSVRKGTCVKRV